MTTINQRHGSTYLTIHVTVVTVIVLITSFLGVVQSGTVPEQSLSTTNSGKLIRYSSSASDSGGWIPKTGVSVNDWTVSPSQIQNEYSTSSNEQHDEPEGRPISVQSSSFTPTHVDNQFQQPQQQQIQQQPQQQSHQQPHQQPHQRTKPISIVAKPMPMSHPPPQWMTPVLRNRPVPRPPVRPGLLYRRRRPGPGPDFYRRSKRKSKPPQSRLMNEARRRKITFPSSSSPSRRVSIDNSNNNNNSGFTDKKPSIFRFDQPQGSNLSPNLYFQQQGNNNNNVYPSVHPVVRMTRLRNPSNNNKNKIFPCAFRTESTGRNGEWCIEV